MGLNVKDIQLHLFRVVHDSTKSSYTFLQRHPFVSGASLVCLILYIFLSNVYSFLVYISPFLVCAIIFIRIFWSSERTQLKYVKREEEKGEQKKVEPKYSDIPNNRRHELLCKYPSQNATSRRRNFTDKKWDVYGGLEEKAKDLSAVFHNEFTKRNMEKKEVRYFEKGESSFDYGLSTKKNQVSRSQTLRSEPSMVDLVECGDVDIEKVEDGDDEDENRNKAIEWTEDDQKNLMNLGLSEMERNKRLESLIARRRARKLFKLQNVKGPNDKKPIAPLLTTRGKPFDSSKDFEDDLEMPGSAPSVMPRSPYDIPYDPSEEKLNLTGDSFLQAISCHQKDMPFCRHESFSLGHLFPSETNQDHGTRMHYSFNNGRKYSDRLAYSRFRRTSDKGNHDWLIDRLLYNEGSENAIQASNPQEHETTHEEDGKCKTDMANMKDEKADNDHETKSISDQISESNLVSNISNIENARVSKKSWPGQGFPLCTTTATTTTTNINESMYDTVTSVVDKRQESMILSERRICHTPTYSIASDLQVEVSEVGSPTSTVDEKVETNSSTDRDSTVYDGDIDRDVSSGSEDLWGASFHGGREAQGTKSEEDSTNNNSRDVVSPIALRQIDEENVADVSSLSSNPDIPEDTPTYAINSNHNIFGYMNHSVRETEAPQSSNIFGYMDQLPNETLSERPEEWCNMPENVINEAQIINDVNNTTITEQDDIENSRSNEDPPGTSVVRQESIDETSIYSISSSPRSVLPEKTIADEVSPSAFDQHMHISPQQSIMESTTQETLNSESTLDTMPQTIPSLMDDTVGESQNVDFNHSQEQINPPENSTEESNILGNIDNDEVYNKEEQDKLKNDENNEDNSNQVNIQQATSGSTRKIEEITTSEAMDDKSRDLEYDKQVPSIELIEDHKNDKPSSSNSVLHEDLSQQRGTRPMIHNKKTSYSIHDIFD